MNTMNGGGGMQSMQQGGHGHGIHAFRPPHNPIHGIRPPHNPIHGIHGGHGMQSGMMILISMHMNM